jgi:hypothetical protein
MKLRQELAESIYDVAGVTRESSVQVNNLATISGNLKIFK